MVGGNSALLLLIEENQGNTPDKDLCSLLEKHVKVDLIINLSFLKCLKEDPKNASKGNYGLCIESSTIDLSFCKKLNKDSEEYLKEYLKEYIECLKKCCPESNTDEYSKFLEKYSNFLNDGPDKCDELLGKYFELLAKYSEFLENCCPTLNKKKEYNECHECVEKCCKLNEYIDFIERL